MVKRTDSEVKGFTVLPKRRIVERTFGWVNEPGIARDYEKATRFVSGCEGQVMICRRDEDHSSRDDSGVNARATAGSGGIGWLPKGCAGPANGVIAPAK